MQTIFNVPSADVTPEKRFFIQEEAQTAPWDADYAYIGTTYTAYGVGHDTELEATLYNVSSPDIQDISVGIGFKSSVPLPIFKEKCPKREIKLTVGSDVLIGLEGNGVGNWTYAHLSGRLPKLNTRLTAGISYGTKQVFGIDNATTFMAGVEQPINKKLTLMGDWFSGSEHWAGFLMVGFSYNLKKDTTMSFGYQIPNSPNAGSGGFVIQLGRTF